jgi:hypothetical protein
MKELVLSNFADHGHQFNGVPCSLDNAKAFEFWHRLGRSPSAMLLSDLA